MKIKGIKDLFLITGKKGVEAYSYLAITWS